LSDAIDNYPEDVLPGRHLRQWHEVADHTCHDSVKIKRLGTSTIGKLGKGSFKNEMKCRRVSDRIYNTTSIHSCITWFK